MRLTSTLRRLLMVNGQKYFTWYESPKGFKQALEATWTGDRTDILREQQGRIMKSLREAKDKVGLK